MQSKPRVYLIYILQYNHDRIQKKNRAIYTNLFPFEHNGAQFDG